MEIENAKYIAFPGLSHIAVNIFKHLDGKSLLQARATCVQWANLIDATPTLWKPVFKKLRRKYLLVNSIWDHIQKNVPLENYPEMCLTMMAFNWRDLPNYNIDSWDVFNGIKHQYSLFMIYGDLERLRFFWPYLDSQHPEQILHFAVRFGLSNVLRFLLKNLPNLHKYLGQVEMIHYGCTPLHVAAHFGKYVEAKLLLPYYHELPFDTSMDRGTPLYFAMKNKDFKMVDILRQKYVEE